MSTIAIGTRLCLKDGVVTHSPSCNSPNRCGCPRFEKMPFAKFLKRYGGVKPYKPTKEMLEIEERVNKRIEMMLEEGTVPIYKFGCERGGHKDCHPLCPMSKEKMVAPVVNTKSSPKLPRCPVTGCDSSCKDV